MTKSINKNIKPTIIACGRLVEKKNFIELVHVMPKIIKQFPEAKLIVLGEGPKKEELQSAIKRLSLEKSIELVGFKNNPYSYFAAAHVFVQTSLWEGFGYVLAEALACGTPVVAYDSKGAMKEILENGRYGILVPPGNKEALVKSIIKQIEKPRNSDFYRKAVLRFEVNKITFDYLKVLGMTN